MSIIFAIVLGAVQGVTEFLPVSSSGHLVVCHIAPHFRKQAAGIPVGILEKPVFKQNRQTVPLCDYRERRLGRFLRT